MKVGDRIALARDMYNLNQVQLGAHLGITRASISQYEKRQMQPTLAMVERLAQVFNCDPEWFYWGHGKGPSPLDAPVTIPAIRVERLTPKVTDPRDLAIGHPWRLPAGALLGAELHDDVVAILAPNAAGAILAGDWVLIDLRSRDGEGEFLIGAIGSELRHLSAADRDAPVLGRAIAYLRTL